MRRSLFPFLLAPALGACEDPPTDLTASRTAPTLTEIPAGVPAGEPEPPPELRWTDDPLTVDADGSDQHHATVAIAQGNPWVSYQRADTVRTRRLDPVLGPVLIDDTEPVPFNHPKISGGPVGIYAVAALTVGGISVRTWSAAGGADTDPVWLDLTDGRFPDVSARSTGGLVVWTHLDGTTRCAGWSGASFAPATVPCVQPLDPAHQVSTLEVDLGPTGWLTWSEASLGTPATVGLAHAGPGGIAESYEVRTVFDDSFDARPEVAGVANGGLLVWRGADAPTEPRQAWITAFDDPEVTGEPRPLGGPGADRPVVVAEGEAAVVAWEEAGTVWIGLVDPRTADPIWGPEPANTTGAAARPSLAIEPTDDGWIGMIGWENQIGAALVVQVRTFAILP